MNGGGAGDGDGQEPQNASVKKFKGEAIGQLTAIRSKSSIQPKCLLQADFISFDLDVTV